MSQSPNYRSPTRSSSSKSRPPIRLEQRVVQLTDAVEDLREDLAHEVSCTEQLEKLSDQYQQDTTVKLSSLRQNFESFSQSTLIRLENVRAEILEELSEEVKALLTQIEQSKKQISDLQLNQDDLGRRLERQTRQLLTQENLGERLTRDTTETFSVLDQLKKSYEGLKLQLQDQSARQNDFNQHLKQSDVRLNSHDIEIKQVKEDASHCFKFLSSIREESARATAEMTENMRELRTQFQALKWRQEDDLRVNETKNLECESVLNVRNKQRLERGHGTLSDGISELQAQLDDVQDSIRRRTFGGERASDSRLRASEQEMARLRTDLRSWK